MSNAIEAGMPSPGRHAAPGRQEPAASENRIRVALGLGCDRGTPWATLAQAIDEALAQAGVAWPQVRALASIDLKADEVAMHQLMQARGLPIRFYAAAELATVPVPNPSEVVRKYTGTPSVSEAAALRVAAEVVSTGQDRADRRAPAVASAFAATVGDDPAAKEAVTPDASVSMAAAPMSSLIVEKHKLRGPDGRNATVSVARLPVDTSAVGLRSAPPAQR